MDKINLEHDARILKMKLDVEKMYRDESTMRGLRARANSGVSGFALFGDNVGKIVNPR